MKRELIDQMVVKAPANEYVELLTRDLLVLPEKMIMKARDMGLKIFVLDYETRASYIGLKSKNDVFTCDNRTFDDIDIAWFQPDERYIALYSKTLFEDDGFKTAIHEFGHVIDFILGQGEFWSNNFLASLKNNHPLDWYASTTPCEQFAQAIEAYYRANRENSSSYRVHTRSELANKSLELFNYLDVLLKDGEFNE